MRDLFPEQNFFVTLFDDRVYAVGGAVRDLFLERERGDVDLLVVREEIDGVIATLPNVDRFRKGQPTWGDDVILHWEPDSCVVLTI